MIALEPELSGPRLDLLVAAAVRESFRPAELLNLWLNKHEGVPAGLVDEAIDAALDLKEFGIEAPGPDGSPAFRLQLKERREALGKVGIERARAEALAVASEHRTPTERALLSLLRSEGKNPDLQDRDELVAWQTAVTWIADLDVGATPNAGEIDQQIDRLDYLRVLGGPDLRRFVGRKRELAELTGAWRKSGSRIVLIEGPGGIGKSLLISRFIAGLLEPDSRDPAPDAIFHIDFDRRNLQRGGSSAIFAELMRQAERWVRSDASRELRDIGAELTSSGGFETSSRRSRSSYSLSNVIDPMTRLVGLLSSGRRRIPFIGNKRPRIILFADTFEQVIRFNDEAVHGVEEVRAVLERAGADVFAIYASRAFDHGWSSWDEHYRIRIPQLPRDDALRYLIDEAKRIGVKIGPHEADGVLAVVQGSPLALRLAVSLLEKEGPNTDPRAWIDDVGLSSDRIQASLYDRILLRIRDEDLRKIAMPGLLVRRLTAQLIAEVLAGPCGLVTSNPADWMWLAEQEGQLFQRDPLDPDALWHRQDVRSLMLPDLDRCIDPVIAGEINERAIHFYEVLGDPASRAEELYHRLRLDQPVQVIDSRWSQDAGESLRSAIDELPPRAQTYLRERLGGASVTAFAGEVRQLDADDPRVREVRGVAERLLQGNAQVAEVWTLLRSQGLAELRGPLGDVVADLLIAGSEFEELIKGARDIPAHPNGADVAIRAEIFCAVANVHEGLGQVRDASRYWNKAARIASAEHVALNSIVGLYRTGRKLGMPTPTEAPISPSDALRRIQLVGRQLFELRVLAREAVAELGGRTDFIAGGEQFVELSQMLLRTGEAFPSAIQNNRRAEEIGLRLLRRPTQHVRELQDIASKLLDDVRRPEFMLFVEILREEVEWTLARAVGKFPDENNLQS